MKLSGTKLVVALACLALAMGVASWAYRYGATHRATQFWGGEAARLLAQPSQVEILGLELAGPGGASRLRFDLGRSYQARQIKDLTNARGMVHFRHVLMTDRSYVWTQRPEPQQILWRWCLRFHEEDRQVFVVLAEDLATIGYVLTEDSQQVRAISCQPMAATLQQYFGDDLGLLGASTPK